MTGEIKNDKSDQSTGQQTSNTPVQDNQTIQAAKDAVAKAQELATQGMNTAKKKFEEAGGVEGLKTKGKGFISEVKAGFISDENTTGFKGFMSRFKNLWKSGKSGKISIVAVVLILFMVVNSGENIGETGSGISDAHGITIKGLYVGMQIDDAHNTLSKIFDASICIVDPIKKLEGGPWITGISGIDDSDFQPYVRVNADSVTKKVKEIIIDEDAVNYLFNVTDMDASDFVDAIMENYDVPNMTPLIEDDGNIIWEYRDPRGSSLKIDNDKSLTIEKNNADTERKFD